MTQVAHVDPVCVQDLHHASVVKRGQVTHTDLVVKVKVRGAESE